MVRSVRPNAPPRLIALFVCALAHHVISAQPSADVSSAANALAGSITARSGAAFTRWNPAACEHGDTSFNIDCAIAAGGLAGLVDGSTLAVRDIDSNLMALVSVGGFSFGPYSFAEFATGASIHHADELVFGTSIRICVQSILRYGVSAALMLDAGARLRITRTVCIGLVARNINRASLRGAALPQQLAAGVVADIGDSVSMSFDAIHESGRGASASAAVQAFVARRLCVRIGISLEAPTLAGGIGYEGDDVSVDISSSWNSSSGTRHTAGIGMRW